jgi:endonuclease G, mitochondrial
LAARAVRKLLILLGAARYPASPDLALAAFAPSHAGFLAAMTSGERPIVAKEDVLDLFDTDAHWTKQQLDINDWLKERTPDPEHPCALLIYYVGHGGLADDGSQFFMAINSTNDFDPLASSISRDSFIRTLNRAARLFRKYLIIDCCFAAKVIQGMQGAVDSKMRVELNEVDRQLFKDDSTGLAAICSSDSISTSNAQGRNGLTQFTDALLETLRMGDPNGEAELTFENLRVLIESQLKKAYGDSAVPPSSVFSDDVKGPIHRLGLFPNIAQRLPAWFKLKAELPPQATPFPPRTSSWLPRGRDENDVKLQLALGNPSAAKSDPDNFLIQHPQYSAAFDSAKGRPRWVSWHLRAEDLGRAPRKDRWSDDPQLPKGISASRMSMFIGSGFDRGCLCPSGNRSATVEDRNAVCLLTNVLAQEPRRNRDLWAGFEKFCADLVKANQIDLYIIAGPLGSRQYIAGTIDVPAALWKIALIVPEGEVPGPSLKTAEVIAIRMANSAEASIADWTETIVTVSSIEDDTGLKLLATLSPELRDQLRRRRAAYMADLIHEVTQGRPPLGIGAVRAAPSPVAAAISDKDKRLFDSIRGSSKELGRIFHAHPKTSVLPATLQRLASPIATAGKSLTNLSIVDELLAVSGVQRDASIFAAAVIIYERREDDYFDRLLAIAADGGLRGAPMWRVLRAIKRLCGRVELSTKRREALVAALSNCARNYDTIDHQRFQTRDIVLLVAQTVSLKRLKLDLSRDGIFSAEQMAQWENARARLIGRPVQASAPAQPTASPALERREFEALRATLSGTQLDRLEVRWIFANPPKGIATLVKIGDAMGDTQILSNDEMSRLPQDIVAQIMAGFAVDDTLMPLFQVIAEGKIDTHSLYKGDSVKSVLSSYGTREWVENIGSPIRYVGPHRDLLFPLNMKGTAIFALGKTADDCDAEPEFGWEQDFPRAFEVTRHRFTVAIELSGSLSIAFDYDETALAATVKRERGASLRAAFPDRLSFSLTDRPIESTQYLAHLKNVLRKAPDGMSSRVGDAAWSTHSTLEIRVNGIDMPLYVYAVTRKGLQDYTPDLGAYDNPETEYRYVRFDAELIEQRGAK